MKTHIIAISLATLSMVSTGLAIEPGEIIAKVSGKYAALTSLSTSGTIVTETADSKDTAKFTIKLARPALYHVKWESAAVPGEPAGVNQGKAWSDGTKHFLRVGNLLDSTEKDMDTGLAAATGVSHGAAQTMPAVFFKRPASLLGNLKDLVQQKDEMIGNDSCFVLSGTKDSLHATLWITREYLVRQIRYSITNRKLNNEELAAVKALVDSDDFIKKLQAETEKLSKSGIKPTPEQLKEQLAETSALLAKTDISGTITETYDAIELNPNLPAASFQDSPR